MKLSVRIARRWLYGLLCLATIGLSSFNLSDKKLNSSISADDFYRGANLYDKALKHFFVSEQFIMYRYYNPFEQVRGGEKASVWMYTSAIEATNSLLRALYKHKDSISIRKVAYYEGLLEKLYDNAAYYLGTFTYTSFTQTKEWTVYAVNRAEEKGKANVTGILNVYDDQMWLVRELLESYDLTQNSKYLEQAEYLTAYVLDGWDATRDEEGNEHGGISWGPGYVTKHACSNGPMISALVWLHELYKKKNDKVVYRYIDSRDRKTRKVKKLLKRDYYLMFAKKIYHWQKRHLLNDQGVYWDMMGQCAPDCQIRYEEVGGQRYRGHTQLLKATGKPYSYNSGTMLSGAADLYRATKQKDYLDDAKALAKASFLYFAKADKQLKGYYSFPTDGFNNWFHTVLLKGYTALLPYDPSVLTYVQAFRANLNYAYSNYYKDGILPRDLLGGWDKDSRKNNVEGMFMFSYVTQYALFATYL